MWRLAAIAALVSCPAIALAQDSAAQSNASAPIVGTGGKAAGTVELTDTPNGVLIVATFEPGALAAGEHAIHVHEKGDCSDTAKFETAGGHYNPAGAEHGYMPEAGPHAGDMPNFVAVEGQPTKVSLFNDMVRFKDGEAPLFDADGSALVVHANPDDYQSQPSGNAGDRIACAELKGE
jgi:Cu-Zn family superoxide dismutase